MGVGSFFHGGRGVARGGKGALKGPNNVASTVLNTVHLFQKEFMFAYGGAKLVSCTV